MFEPKLCFSSLGCPEMDHPQIVQLAVDEGIWGVELRGKSENAHISPQTPAVRRKQIARLYADNGVAIAGITSYVQMADIEKAAQNQDQIMRYAELCAQMGASYLRIYLGQMQNQPLEDQVAPLLAQACRSADSFPVKILLEMHDALKTGAQARSLIRAAGDPENLGVIFDTVLPFRQQEDPLPAWQSVADSVGALHIRAVGSDAHGETHQVLPEDSRYPFDALLKTLLQAQFDGPWVILWERIFDPTLCPMPQAIGAYRRAIECCMQRLG